MSYSRIERALSQRLHVLRRSEDSSDFTIQGSTGAYYNVQLDYEKGFCTCNCPDAVIRGQRCKHILFVLLKVLRLATNHVLYRNLGYIRDDLDRALRDVVGNRERPSNAAPAVDRRPFAGVDCGICFDEMDADDKENLVYCERGCGQHVHGACMQKWLLREQTCVYCRCQWWN